MKKIVITLSVLLSLAACGGSSSSVLDTADAGDTAGDSTLDTANLATHVYSSADALLLSVAGDSGSSSESALLTYSPDGDWTTYTSTENVAYLEEIFGADLSGPVTQVRVLLDQFSSDLTSLISIDAALDCTGTTALTDADSVEVAFLGTLDNGDAGDRNFDCFSQSSEQALIYGSSSDGVVRIASTSDTTSDNSQEVETRGDQERLMQVVLTSYAEVSESDTNVGYLDLQYAQATVYNGVDDTFGTDDDMVFRSRSRITGRVEYDAEGNAVIGEGDFTVTKYDAASTPEGDPYTIVTQTMGRGSYGDGEYSLFSIDSTVTDFATIPGSFCLQASASVAVPEVAASSNCSALETGFAWGDATFPFDLTPSVSATFEDNGYFEGDDVDLIATDGSNFIVPTY